MYLNILQAAFIIFTTVKNLNLIKSPKYLRRNGQRFEKAFLQTQWNGAPSLTALTRPTIFAICNYKHVFKQKCLQELNLYGLEQHNNRE